MQLEPVSIHCVHRFHLCFIAENKHDYYQFPIRMTNRQYKYTTKCVYEEAVVKNLNSSWGGARKKHKAKTKMCIPVAPKRQIDQNVEMLVNSNSDEENIDINRRYAENKNVLNCTAWYRHTFNNVHAHYDKEF
jgi:hypothetical protein